jgi:hypothetical protein
MNEDKPLIYSDKMGISHISVRVSAYAGYKGEERPLKINIQGKWHDVLEVSRAWLEPGKRFFDLKLSHSTDRIRVYYDEKGEDWFLCKTL